MPRATAHRWRDSPLMESECADAQQSAGCYVQPSSPCSFTGLAHSVVTASLVCAVLS